ncbi:hypothetical protein SCLCIDRAFT_1219671 [Scleroderma citrinum Foug A]|uniref:Uncharacterized protein n=1 Tax=Scleroderma citrinum Foug A TaxID=1036808 RepID=A0A0C2ZXM5_9AGAM|nr:hypothetical protein SCLCIDRAFT_1219671 [Scleroderma citrinum Foug A]
MGFPVHGSSPVLALAARLVGGLRRGTIPVWVQEAVVGAYRGEYCFHTQIPAFIDWLCFIVRQLPSLRHLTPVVRDNDNDKCYHTHVSAPDLAMGPSIYARKPKPKDVGALSSYAGVNLGTIERSRKTRPAAILIIIMIPRASGRDICRILIGGMSHVWSRCVSRLRCARGGSPHMRKQGVCSNNLAPGRSET